MRNVSLTICRCPMEIDAIYMRAIYIPLIPSFQRDPFELVNPFSNLQPFPRREIPSKIQLYLFQIVTAQYPEDFFHSFTRTFSPVRLP